MNGRRLNIAAFLLLLAACLCTGAPAVTFALSAVAGVCLLNGNSGGPRGGCCP